MKHSALILALLTFYSMPAPARAQDKSTDDNRPTASQIQRLDPEMAERQQADDGLSWHDVSTWEIEGRILPNAERKRWFDRLPSTAEGQVTSAVWNLSRHSSGMMVRFKTDATAIHVHYKLLKANLAMAHMPATGVSGVDLYARDAGGNWRWVQVTRPSAQEVKAQLVSGLEPGTREFAAYLPLYNGVEFLSIGVPPGSQFESLAPRSKPIVFYGTSITHGACASRPGMVHTAILGRRFDMPVVNLGFSGNGRMEPEVGALLAELDPCVFAIDCLPNMNAEMLTERAAPLVRQLREAHRDTPVLLVEDRTFTNAPFFPSRAEHHQKSRAAFKQAYLALLDAGVENLYYLDGEHLLGHDGEAATDGSHPNDMGMVRYADAYEPALRALLGQY